jgi:redox-regulated HSP33 family molecular chaperone
MREPRNHFEMIERFERNTYVDAEGKQHVPCHFCGMGDVMQIRPETARKLMEAGVKCKHCGRSYKALFNEAGDDWELILNSGPKAPEWMEAPIWSN